VALQPSNVLGLGEVHVVGLARGWR
jgi:hypothetical protein